MGKGIDLIRDINPLHAQVLDDFKDQLLIVFLKRLGGEVSIPVKEVDDTSNDMLAFSINTNPFTGEKDFHFVIQKKN